MKYTLDSSCIVKALLPPKRKKKDTILKQQIISHKKAKNIFKEIVTKESTGIIPTLALIEVATVMTRLTNNPSLGKETSYYISQELNIVSEEETLKESIDLASKYCFSGFDTLFVTCAKITKSTLVTSDKKMAELAKQAKVKVILI